MGVELIDDAARAAFDRAIKAIEAASSVEVVVATRRRSGNYHHANAIVALVAATAVLAVLLFSEPTYSLGGILIAPLVFGALAGLATEWLPGVKRALAPRGWRTAHVTRAARATFVERGVHATRGRTGVLAYVSRLERQVVLVPDRAAAAALGDALAQVEAAMTAAFARGGFAMAEALATLAAPAGRALPHADDDANELPDALDEEAS